jgi:tRNA (cytidine/uridine-2'-O-)-methyltransferase
MWDRAMRLVLYQPDIPQNTGTLLRLSACLAVPIDLIGPAAFDFSDRSFRRAGLDYLEHARITRHESFEAFDAARRALSPIPRIVLLTTHAETTHVDFRFCESDLLLLGRESAGVPQSVHDRADARIRVPMRAGLRSLNIAVAGAMVLGEALRQTNGFPASSSGT